MSKDLDSGLRLDNLPINFVKNRLPDKVSKLTDWSSWTEHIPHNARPTSHIGEKDGFYSWNDAFQVGGAATRIADSRKPSFNFLVATGSCDAVLSRTPIKANLF